MAKVAVANVNAHAYIPGTHAEVTPIIDPETGDVTGYYHASVSHVSVAQGTTAAHVDTPGVGGGIRTEVISKMGVQTNGRPIITTSDN